MHLLEISIFSLTDVIIRPTKIMNRATKIGHTCKGWSSSIIFFIEKNLEGFGQFLMLKKDFESQNFAIFEEVVHNFGRSDDDII